MSWKGFQKTVVRTPQTVKARFNMGEISKDAIYIDAERRFQELETETKKLHDESKKYSDSINNILTHQIEFSKACAEIYRPISGRVSDPDSFIQEGNPEGIRACEEYESIVHDLQETLAPELEMIESRVIKPADELLEIIKVVRKTAQKRDHKQLDYDRHRLALKKLQDKKDKTLKDEKALYKAENDVEQATQDYNYFNELLKNELPELFRLEREFIKPLFQSFYYMQLNVFYTLHERMQNIDIGYFDLTLDIEDSFEAKRGTIQAEVEALSITKFKTTGGRRPGVSKYGNKPLAIEAGPGGKKPLAIEEGYKPRPLEVDASKSKYASGKTFTPASEKAGITTEAQKTIEAPPPPYSPASTLSPPGSASLAGIAKSKGPAPPPPKPKPARLSGNPAVETVTALFDYEAQAEGDLSFSTGEVIEIVTRTDNTNEWWIGKIGTRQGQFPGNYVQINH
ncbi:BAR-domain-containing protein [Tothia fuscella]|uniref:BAR-domain-containing protein n=1 Tax=Tothia fuscella TaxID=1048955 RepID=A0A9P4NIH2_9PEZI|nr:BAR-domain-containing protein [Tothia fuscella]